MDSNQTPTPTDPWVLDTRRNKYYYVEGQYYVYADGERLPIPATPAQANQGAGTLSQQESIQKAVPVTSGPSSQHHHTLSGGSTNTTWSINTGLTSLSLQDAAPSNSTNENYYQSGSYSQPSCAVSSTAPCQEAVGGPAHEAEAQPDSERTISPGAQIPSQIAVEPSDDEKLMVVDRSEEEPGPEVIPGLLSHKILRGTSGEYEKLDPAFRVRRNAPGYTYFKKGTVFRVLWPELASDRARPDATIATTPRFPEEKIFVKIRWFVVVREGNDCCTCLSIQTYGNRGVPPTKVKSHHSIIYTGDHPPEPAESEVPVVPWEAPMGTPIKVIPEKPWEKLDPMSRVNFLKLYTVEHYVKLDHFGKVDPASEWSLIHQFNSHWKIPEGISLPPATRPARESIPAYTPLHSSQAPGNYGLSPVMPPIQEHSTASGHQAPHTGYPQLSYPPPHQPQRRTLYPPQYSQTGPFAYHSNAQSPHHQSNPAPQQYHSQPSHHQLSPTSDRTPRTVPHPPHGYPNTHSVAGQSAFQPQQHYGQPPLSQQSAYPNTGFQPAPRSRRSSQTSDSSYPPRKRHPDDYRPNY